MAYTAWSVVYGEQPTAAKWNQLGTNDAGFKDGTNIDDNAILQRHLSDNIVGVNEVKAGAILLGSASRTSNFATTSSTFTDVTSITSTVTVPSGGRDVKVSFEADRWACSSTGVGVYAALLYDGAIIGTYTLTAHNTANGAIPLCFFAKHTPSAGSHTYKLQIKTDGGTLTITASATSPSILLVEAL